MVLQLFFQVAFHFVEVGRRALLHLDQVIAERRFHRLADLAGLQGKHGLFELWNHPAAAQRAQFPALGAGGGVVGFGLGHGREILALHNALPQRLGLGQRLGVGQFLLVLPQGDARALEPHQEMPRLDLLEVRLARLIRGFQLCIARLVGLHQL